MTFFKFRDILRACTLPAVLVTSSDLSLSGNEAEEDEDVGMYVVPPGGVLKVYMTGGVRHTFLG